MNAIANRLLIALIGALAFPAAAQQLSPLAQAVNEAARLQGAYRLTHLETHPRKH